MPKVTARDLETLPWEMLPAAKDYLRTTSGEGTRARALASSAMLGIGRELDREGVRRWQEVKPVHYETWLRRREQAALMGTPEQRAEFANEHFRLTEFFEGLTEKGLMAESPADGFRVRQDGVVMKFENGNPALDRPIAEFVEQGAPSAQVAGSRRSNLRALAGALLARGIRQWRDVSTGHMEVIAQDWVNQSRAAGKPSANTVQNRLRTARAFFDYQVERGNMVENPAETVASTARGRVTTHRNLNPEMLAQAKEFVEAQTRNTEGTRGQMISAATRLAVFACGECGVRSWGELTPEQYEEFLRMNWGREYRNPTNAMFTQSSTKRMLAHFKDRNLLKEDPSANIHYTMSGMLCRKGRAKEALPEQVVAKHMAPPKERPAPAGFEREVDDFLEHRSQNRNVASMGRTRRVLPEVAHRILARGGGGWEDIKREDLIEYGRELVRDEAFNSATNDFSEIRSFVKVMFEHGKLETYPACGMSITRNDGFVVNPAPADEMVKEMALYTKGLPPRVKVETWRRLQELGANLANSGKAKWEAVAPEDLSCALRETVNDSSKRNLTLCLARRFYGTLVQRGVLQRNPASRLTVKNVWPRAPRSPSVSVEREDSVHMPAFAEPPPSSVEMPEPINPEPSAPGHGGSLD